jgi:hypothetical protein
MLSRHCRGFQLRTCPTGACMQCEGHIERLEHMALPSLGRFDAKARACMDAFSAQCVGPARAHQEERLQHAFERERARFTREYNDRLYSGLVVITLVAAIVCRFVLKKAVPEMLGWGAFVFLEVREPCQCSWTTVRAVWLRDTAGGSLPVSALCEVCKARLMGPRPGQNNIKRCL